MLTAGSSAHILLGLCPARTRDDCTRCSARVHNRTVILPEAHSQTLSGPTPVFNVATTPHVPTHAKILPFGGGTMGCHVATPGRLHSHRFL